MGPNSTSRASPSTLYSTKLMSKLMLSQYLFQNIHQNLFFLGMKSPSVLTLHDFFDWNSTTELREKRQSQHRHCNRYFIVAWERCRGDTAATMCLSVKNGASITVNGWSAASARKTRCSWLQTPWKRQTLRKVVFENKRNQLSYNGRPQHTALHSYAR